MIELSDVRGTSIRLQLYMAEIQIPDYLKELQEVWEHQYGGKADHIVIDKEAQAYGRPEFKFYMHTKDSPPQAKTP